MRSPRERTEEGSSSALVWLIGIPLIVLMMVGFLFPMMVMFAVKPPAQAAQSAFVRDLATSGVVGSGTDTVPQLMAQAFDASGRFANTQVQCVVVRQAGEVVLLVHRSTPIYKGNIVGCRVEADSVSWPLWFGPDTFLGGRYVFTAWAYSDSQDDPGYQ